MDADRRDYTNQYGCQVPTETTALWNVTNEEKALSTARKLYGIFVRACNLCGFRLNKVELERDEYKFTEEDFQNGAR
jgi:hypothetical protein